MLFEELNEINLDNFEKFEVQKNKIESVIRRSSEYRAYLASIYAHAENITSPEFNDVNLLELNTEDFSKELHHLVQLSHLVEMVFINRMMESDQDEVIIPLNIATDVIMLHLNDMIPFVILSKNYHQMVHLGLREVPNDGSAYVHLGDYKAFIKKYHDFLSEDEYEMYLRHGADPKFISKYYHKEGE